MATLITSPWSNGRRFTVVSDDISGVEQAKLLANDGAASAFFGNSVSVSNDGNICVIGAVNSGAAGSQVGAAYIYRRQNGVWNQEAKLTASDGQSGDNFGYSVAVSGDGVTVSVSSINDDDSGSNRGSVYVFVKSGSDWIQQTKLLPPAAEAGTSYGISISLSSDGNTLAVGRHLEDTPTSDAGSVYIYVRTGAVWAQQEKLTVTDASMHFGRSVSLSNSGNDIAIGAYGTAEDNGCVYVFTRSDTTWSQQARLTASDGFSGDSLGYSVSISGDGNTVLSGAYGNDTRGSHAGAAYIYARSGTTWSQHSKLTLSDGSAGDYFGHSVSISDNGSFCAIGAYLDDDKGSGSGAVAIFKKSGAVWDQTFKLLPADGAVSDRFGYSVSLSGDGKTCVGGAYFNTNPRGTNAGAAYVFI